MGNNKKGRMKYVPAIVIDEVEDIQREDKIGEDAQAFRELVGYARVGREMKRIMKLDWRSAKRLPPINAYPTKKKVKKRDEFDDMFGEGDMLP